MYTTLPNGRKWATEVIHMNNQDNKNKPSQENGKGQAPQKSFWKQPFAKRWTFPVIYLAASVLIVGLMYAKSQDASPYKIDKTNDPQAGPVTPINDVPSKETSSTPEFVWPVGEGGEDATVSMDYYRDNSDEEARAAAVVMYDNQFTPHQGVDIGLKSDQPFTVVAAAKGKVISVKEDPLMGKVVEIDHGNGYTTYYASLQNVQVEQGANVLSGQPIAMTGNNKYELAEQNHLHFELRKDGKAVDPLTLLPKKPGMTANAPAAPGGDATATNGDAVIGEPASSDKTDGKTTEDKETTEPAEKPGDKTDKNTTSKPDEKKDDSQSTGNEPHSANH
jgi:stage II sporulation protein Q